MMLKPFQRPVHICLGVCTCRRPVLLSQCLTSIQELAMPDNTTLDIIVVDNDDRESDLVKSIVECFQDDPDSDFQGKIHFATKRQRSIAKARNRILDFALECDADWIVMLDDDQRVPEDWLIKMFTAQRACNAKIVKSNVKYEYPIPTPFWAFPKKETKKFSAIANTIATNGVLFSRALIDPKNCNLRFNEAFGLSSGEDRDFFLRAKRLGMNAVKTSEAVATEVLPSTKLTLGAQIKWKFCNAWVNVHQDKIFNGLLFTFFDNAPKIFSNVLLAVFFMVLTILTLPFAPRRGCQHFLRASKRLAKACGIVMGMTLGHQPAPYRNVHGY